MSIRPIYRPKIVKKRTKKFVRHQSDRYDKLKVSIDRHTCFCDCYLNIFRFDVKIDSVQNPQYSFLHLPHYSIA